MTKRIQLPSNHRGDVELSPHEIVPLLKVSQHVTVIWAGFVRAHKAAMQDFNLTTGNQLFDLFSDAAVLSLVESSEKCEVANSVSNLRLIDQKVTDGFENLCYILSVVLVVCFQPSGIEMAVWDKVHLDLILNS